MAVTDVVGWISPAGARAQWSDAPKVDSTLEAVLAAAYGVCLPYAPALGVDEAGVPVPPPANYQLAQVLQARALWAAARRDGDVLGFDDGSAVRVRPLDGTVKVLLRPPTGRGVIG